MARFYYQLHLANGWTEVESFRAVGYPSAVKHVNQLAFLTLADEIRVSDNPTSDIFSDDTLTNPNPVDLNLRLIEPIRTK